MDLDIFAVPLTPHLRHFEPLMAREVRHTLSLLPRPAAHFVAVLFYNYMRQMRRAWRWHFSLSFEMGYYSESLERATLQDRSRSPDHREFWQVDMEYVELKLQDWQVRYDMGQECIAWHHFRTHLPCWEILMRPAQISGLYG